MLDNRPSVGVNTAIGGEAKESGLLYFTKAILSF